MKHGAITGNLGSGKSTVAAIFELMNVAVYYSDERAKLIMNRDPVIQKQIIKLIGRQAIVNGQINRAYVAKRIFGSPTMLKRMNGIVHPAVRKDYTRWRNKQKGKITLQESALTFEIGAESIMDFTIVVHAPVDILIARGMKRDGVSREAIVKRLEKQMPQEQKMERATYLIDNGGERGLIKQVMEVYEKILSQK